MIGTDGARDSKEYMLLARIEDNMISTGRAHGVMDTVTRVQILDETDCISHSINTLGKGMNPIILPPAMST